MDKPVIDPPIPYIGPICGGRFGPGKRVRIQGMAPSIAYRFDINLQCGSQTAPQDDIAVHISVHLLDGYIAMNFLENGIWGEEQKRAQAIRRAEKFEIILACGFSEYEVVINGRHYCTFPQRIHYDRISHLAIEGEVSIAQINYDAGSADGFSGPSKISSMRYPHKDDFDVVNPNVLAAPPAGLNPPPSLGFSSPLYGTALSKQETPSYSTPYPSSAVSYPPANTGYPVTPTTALLPVNADGSQFTNTTKSLGQRLGLTCCAFVFMTIIISILIWTVSYH